MARFASALFPLLLAGCGTTRVQLPYTPTAAVSPANGPGVGLGDVVDARGEGGTWLGAIRGGYGDPLKVLRTDRPMREVVQQAFHDALAARGLLTPAGSQRREVRVTVHRLGCSRYMRSEAHADLAVEVVDRATGQTVYADRAGADRVEGDVLTSFGGGVFGSVEELRALTNQVQNEAIDRLLSEPGFLAAVRPAGAPRV